MTESSFSTLGSADLCVTSVGGAEAASPCDKNGGYADSEAETNINNPWLPT